MTAAPANNPFAGFLQSMSFGLRRLGMFGAKLMLAVAVIMMAGVIAVATAAAGLAIAAVALFMRFASGPRAKTRRTSSPRGSSDDGMTLEARPSARGWTVE